MIILMGIHLSVWRLFSLSKIIIALIRMGTKCFVAKIEICVKLIPRDGTPRCGRDSSSNNSVWTEEYILRRKLLTVTNGHRSSASIARVCIVSNWKQIIMQWRLISVMKLSLHSPHKHNHSFSLVERELNTGSPTHLQLHLFSWRNVHRSYNKCG